MSSTLVIPRKVTNLLGLKFDLLEVESYLGVGKFGRHYWFCKCNCGGTIKIPSGRINKPYGPASCGCLRVKKLNINRANPTKHGLHKHKLYAIYYGMLQRCYNSKSQRYKYYGSSGIAVCADWREGFLSFYEWAITNGYEDGLSIDRLDSSEDYHPSNCEWVTVSENSRRMNVARNRRTEVQKT
jgi:hypothetical protein